MKVQSGEWLRKTAFGLQDRLHDDHLTKLTEANTRDLRIGVTPAYQERRLRQIMDYAAKNSPFYRDLELGEEPQLSDFPVQNKADFIEHHAGIVSDEFRALEDKLAKLSTSGSTGTPFIVPADPGKMNHISSNFLSVYGLNGYRLGMKRAEFRAWNDRNRFTPIHCIKSNLIMVDISRMGDEALQKICDQLRDRHVQCLVLYSSALTALTEYMEKKSIDPSLWDIEMIFTMGEALPEETRKKADLLFGTCPVKSYGNNENGFVAVSFNGDSVYHADLFNYYIEILKMDSDEPAAEGETGRIVLTDLYNKAFPMIRYDTGDTGIYTTGKNEKGRIEGTFTAIYGRRGSLIRSTSGEPLSIHVFMNTLLYFDGILRQAKCIQTGLKDYTLVLNPVNPNFDQTEILARYRSYLGQDAEIKVEIVDQIPILQSGKASVCEQKCPEYL